MPTTERTPQNGLSKWVGRFILSTSMITLAAPTWAAVTPPVIKSLRDLDTCQIQNDDQRCLQALEKYAVKNPKDAQGAGQWVRKNFDHWAALRYFEIALQHTGKAVCKDADFQLAMVSALALPPDYPDAVRARTLFTGSCYEDQQAAVIKEIESDAAASYLKGNACPILAAKKQAPPACQPVALSAPPSQAKESLPTIDKAHIKLGTVKVYSGPEGERLTIAVIQGTDLVLIRFEGVDGPWSGKVILHRRAERGHDDADFWTEVDGKKWVSIVQRQSIEVTVPGYSPNGFPIHYAGPKAQAVDIKKLLDDYRL